MASTPHCPVSRVRLPNWRSIRLFHQHRDVYVHVHNIHVHIESRIAIGPQYDDIAEATVADKH